MTASSPGSRSVRDSKRPERSPSHGRAARLVARRLARTGLRAFLGLKGRCGREQSVDLSDQHARRAAGAGGRPRAPRHARRSRGSIPRRHRRQRIPVGLVPGGLADGAGGAGDLPLEPQARRGVPSRPPRSQGRGHLRLPVRHRRLRDPPRLRGGQGPRPPPQAARAAQPQAAARLRPQPHRARSPLGADAPGVLHPGERGRSGAAAAELRAGEEIRRQDDGPRLRPRSLLRRLAGHLPAQLSPRRVSRGADRRARLDRRALRRRPLRHGDAAAAGDHPEDLGRPLTTVGRLAAQGQPVLARSHRRHQAAARRSSSSSPRSTGTWSSRCSRRASTTPTTSAFTIAWWPRPPRRCAST